MLKSLLKPFELPSECTSHRVNDLYMMKARQTMVLADIAGLARAVHHGTCGSLP